MYINTLSAYEIYFVGVILVFLTLIGSRYLLKENNNSTDYVGRSVVMAIVWPISLAVATVMVVCRKNYDTYKLKKKVKAAAKEA